MTKPEIIKETPISMAEMKIELNRLKKTEEELNFRAERTEEYLNTFVELTAAKSIELKKKLTDSGIPRLKEIHIVKIMDTLPVTHEEVSNVLQGYTVTITKDNLKKIAELVKEFVK